MQTVRFGVASVHDALCGVVDVYDATPQRSVMASPFNIHSSVHTCTPVTSTTHLNFLKNLTNKVNVISLIFYNVIKNGSPKVLLSE